MKTIPGPAATIFVLLSVSALWLALAKGAAPQSKPANTVRKGDEPASWQRVLNDKDAKRVEELEKKINQLRQAGRYCEAQAAAQEILTIRTRAQGAEHWETADAQRLLRTLAQLACLPRDVQAEVVVAEKQTARAIEFADRGKYAEADPLFRRALAIRRRLLGEEHLDTAESYNDVAGNLDDLSKYGEAERLYAKAIDIFRRLLGEEHPSTAACYNNAAYNLDAQGRSAEARPIHIKALAIRRRLLGEDHNQTMQSYNNLAFNLHKQGRYAEAEPLYRQVLATRRRILPRENADTARSANNLGMVLHDQGKYAQAEPLLQEALAVRRRVLGEQHPDTADSYNNVPVNLSAQERYAEAEPLLRQALALRQQVLGPEHQDTAMSANNFAWVLNVQGKHAAAERLYRAAWTTCRRVLGDQHPDTALSCNNLAENLDRQGKHAEAEPLYRQALATRRQLLGEAHPDTVAGYTNLAYNLKDQGKYDEAVSLLTAASRSFDLARARISFAGLERTTFAARHSPLFPLAALRARRGDYLAAWQDLEASLARGLVDEVSGRRLRPLNNHERQRESQLIVRLQQLDKQIAALLPVTTQDGRAKTAELHKQREVLSTEFAQFQLELTNKYGAAVGKVYDLVRVQKHLSSAAALLIWVDIQGQPNMADPNGEHWACLVRHRGSPVWAKLPGSGPQGAWTEGDDELPGRARLALANPPGRYREDREAIVRQLVAQRLTPLEPHLRGRGDLAAVKHLIVLPSLSMAGIPVEALTDRYTISYAPSGTLFAWLQEKLKPRTETPFVGDTGSSKPPNLLALGDPAFKPSAFPELPGTRREVKAIARLFPKAYVLFGSDASEEELDQLAASGELRRFRYLHFATHGEMNPRVAMRSALILAQDRLGDPLQRVLSGRDVYDGKLTAQEISETWKLDAELVTLSACQTGVGEKYYGGEGYLGFTQALFLAGARSVVLSLWKVDDTATALLMTRFYQNLLGKRDGLKELLPKAEALREAKQWLRSLTIREVEDLQKDLRQGRLATRQAEQRKVDPDAERPYAHPHYWAAFILIGDPN